MKYIIVSIWGIELARLSYNPSYRQCYFTFNPELKANRPDVSPLLLPLYRWQNHQTAYGDDRRIYQDLPPFIADSLPDSWGNKLFEQWVKRNKLTPRNVTPLYKLMFIGNRGMGALEFKPAAKDLEHTQAIDIKALHELSLKIMNDREHFSVLPTSEIEMAYYEMATDAGINMEECRLLRIEGENHFLTRRFDRKEGEKIHMQTLAAINPD